MSKKNNAPYCSLEEIALRKAQLRKEIALQEKKLSRDFDAYQDDVDTMKTIWTRITNVRNIRKRAHISDIASMVKKPSLGTALTLGIKVAQWFWKRKKR